VSTFKNADEVYEYMGRMFEKTVKDPEFVEATRGGDLVVGLHYTDPDATILIDFPGQSVSFGADAASGSPIVELRMSADDGHKFWLGKLNMTLAMAQRKVKMEGSAAKALKLLPLTKPMFASYETLLRDAGRDDLLKI
jgi:putative sterol carrier protein